MIKCPRCNKEGMLAVQNPQTNYQHTRKCWYCNFRFTPVRFTEDEFHTMEEKLKIRKKREYETACKELERVRTERGDY